MKKLDPESKEFIDWSMDFLDNDQNWEMMKVSAIKGLENFLNQDRDYIKKLLSKKFYIGGLEHGKPGRYTKEQIQEELSLEHQDLLGWPLVGMFSAMKQHEKAGV